MAVGKNITTKKWKGKAISYSLSYQGCTVEKNIKWGKPGTKILGNKIKIKKNGGGEEYQVTGNFTQPCIIICQKSINTLMS